MALLITGSAGFIGFHLARRMLAAGEQVIGIDKLNAYYSVALKNARIAQLNQCRNLFFHQIDITDQEAIRALFEQHPDIDRIVHLAAQAGVRYSLTNPLAYIDANVKGQVILLEEVRRRPAIKSFVYASSSSVYGANTKQPYSVDDPAPVMPSLITRIRFGCGPVGTGLQTRSG